MKIPIAFVAGLLLITVLDAAAQVRDPGGPGASDWDRTSEILNCTPKLIDRMDLVEDQFDHAYVTDNPSNIEVGYFSVEPITFFEDGRRFCEAWLPAAGVSRSYFRGTYETKYKLPGNGVYQVRFESNALIFNNALRIITPQNTVTTIEASHRMQIETDTVLNPDAGVELNSSTSRVYLWEVEVDERGQWQGNYCEGECNMQDEEIPGGPSTISMTREIRGPGVVTIRESVIFHVEALSAYKYEPIFQAVCLFNLEPLSITTKLLPCAR